MLPTDLPDFKTIMARYLHEAFIIHRDQALERVSIEITDIFEDMNDVTQNGYIMRQEETRMLAKKRKDEFQTWLNENRDSMDEYRDSWENIILLMICFVSQRESKLCEDAIAAYNTTLKKREYERMKLIREQQELILNSMEKLQAQTHESLRGADSMDEVLEHSVEFLRHVNDLANIDLYPDENQEAMHRMTDKKNISIIRTSLSYSEERAFLKKIARTRRWDSVEELVIYHRLNSPSSMGKTNVNNDVLFF